MTEQSEAEKAAEEYVESRERLSACQACNTRSNRVGHEHYKAFLAGAAWSAPKWVHVNDKWPEPEKMVLVYIPDAAEWQRIRTTLRVKPEGKHNGLVAQWAGAAIGVTHWCELPAAPGVEK